MNPENNLQESETKKSKIDLALQNFRGLDKTQKISVASLLLLSAALIAGLSLALNPIRPRLTPASSPLTPPNSPSPTTVPSPTSTPIGNIPVINTFSLLSATVNKNYRVKVEGYDLDMQDELSFTATNLPAGLTLGTCNTVLKKVNNIGNRVSYITCIISGKTSQVGKFTVMLNLSDSNNISTKYMNLEVLEF